MTAVALSVSSDCRTAYENCATTDPMAIEAELSRHSSADRADLDSGTRAACSSNGSGGEDEESEADREGGAGGSSTQRALDGTGLAGGREQEVSVEIGETYLCQRADKTWRK